MMVVRATASMTPSRRAPAGGRASTTSHLRLPITLSAVS